MYLEKEKNLRLLCEEFLTSTKRDSRHGLYFYCLKQWQECSVLQELPFAGSGVERWADTLCLDHYDLVTLIHFQCLLEGSRLKDERCFINYLRAQLVLQLEHNLQWGFFFFYYFGIDFIKRELTKMFSNRLIRFTKDFNKDFWLDFLRFFWEN